MKIALDRLRRHTASVVDTIAARGWRVMTLRETSQDYDVNPRFALLTVNRSTTRWLKLMLLSLAELKGLDLLTRIVICDNGSRDGGQPFLRNLAREASRVELIECRFWTHHGPGMRRAITALREAENEVPEQLRANVLWHVDPDVLLLRRDTLVNLAEIFRDIYTAFAGELRRGVHPLPEAQASFLAVRRDWSQRRGVSPWVHGGSPAWPLQRDIWRLGGQGHNFDTYRLGYALHRGRSAVAASRQYHPGSAYASVRNHLPHFMGVPEGQSVWKAIESSYDDWLHTKHEATLVRHLATRFS